MTEISTSVSVELLVSLMFFIPYPQEANLQILWFTDIIRYSIIYPIFFFVCKQLQCKSVKVFYLTVLLPFQFFFTFLFY